MFFQSWRLSTWIGGHPQFIRKIWRVQFQFITWVCTFNISLGSRYTVNVTGETLVLNKGFPSMKREFCQQKDGKVEIIGFFPA